MERNTYSSKLRYGCPHPCAELMREYFAGDDWGDRIQWWRIFRYELDGHEHRLRVWRETRNPPSDPVVALAYDRRAALDHLSVYRDRDMRSLWSRSAYCKLSNTPERKRKWCDVSFFM
jgi:hypothetical protein